MINNMVDFTNSIDYNVPKHNIMNDFFDEHMAIYNLIKYYKIGIQVSAISDGTSIVYNIRPNENYSIEFIKDTIRNNTISVYGHLYNIVEVDSADANMLALTLKEKATII